MRLKVYFLRVALAFATFVLGVGLYGAGQYLKSFFETKPPKASVAVEKQEVVKVVPVTDKSASTETEEEDYGNGGNFYIALDVEDLPKEFKDFGEIKIIDRLYDVDREKYPEGIVIAPEGYVEAKQKYKFTRISVSRKSLSFETEAKKGISYKFVGEFDNDDETATVFKGRLTKMRDGKKLASERFNFEADCG
jgi:hypothetical protein